MVGSALKTCLVIGGADCVWDDLDRYTGPIDGMAACNDVGAEVGGICAWISGHPNYWTEKGWLAKRRANGFADVPLYAHKVQPGSPEGVIVTSLYLPGQKGTGSSGLFAGKVALIDLGFDRIVFCGVPMLATPHFFDDVPWRAASAIAFRRQWLGITLEYRNRMKSMSGWTRELLGAPHGVDG